jgi:hypothetical protein
MLLLTRVTCITDSLLAQSCQISGFFHFLEASTIQVSHDSLFQPLGHTPSETTHLSLPFSQD